MKYYLYVCGYNAMFFNLGGGLEFLKYAINIEEASILYLSPVQKKHVVRKVAWSEGGIEKLILK